MTTPQDQSQDQSIISQPIVGEDHRNSIDDYENTHPHFSLAQQFGNAFSEPWADGALHNLAFHVEYLSKQLTGDVNPLSEEERQNLHELYPNVKIAPGTDRDEANDLIDSYKNDVARERVENTADSFLQNVAVSAGHFTGGITEPVAAVAGVTGAAVAAPVAAELLPEYFVGSSAAAMIGEQLIRTGIEAGGAGFLASRAEEGALAMKDSDTGEDYSFWNGLKNTGLNTAYTAAFGVALHGTFGVPIGKLATHLSENVRDIPEPISKNAQDAYQNFANTASASSDDVIKTAAKKTSYWNKELDVNSSRRVKIMGSLLEAAKNRMDALDETDNALSPEIKQSINDAASAHEALDNAHEDLKNSKRSSNLKHEQVETAINNHSLISVADDDKIQNEAMTQAMNGEEIDVGAMFKTAAIKSQEDLRNSVRETGIEPGLVADKVDEARIETLKDINDTQEELDQNTSDARNAIKSGQESLADELKFKGKMLQEKLAMLNEDEGMHQYLGTALRGDLPEPTGAEVRSQIEKTIGSGKDPSPETPETARIDLNQGNAAFEDLVNSSEATNFDDLKSSQEGFEELNNAAEEGKVELDKSNRRLSKLEAILKSAIDCVGGIL